MAGPIVLLVIMVLIVPPVLFGLGAAVAALLGWTLRSDAEARNEGGELIELNT